MLPTRVPLIPHFPRGHRVISVIAYRVSWMYGLFIPMPPLSLDAAIRSLLHPRLFLQVGPGRLCDCLSIPTPPACLLNDFLR